MTTQITLTKNEQAVLLAIARNEYNHANYGTPKTASETDTFTWTLKQGLYNIPDGFTVPKGKALSGTISSLTEKGMVGSNLEGPVADRGIWMTEAGFAYFTENLASIPMKSEPAPATEPLIDGHGVSTSEKTSEKYAIHFDGNSLVFTSKRKAFKHMALLLSNGTTSVKIERI